MSTLNDYITKYLTPFLCVVCFGSGVLLTKTIYNEKEAREIKQVLEQKALQEATDRKIITDYQTNQVVLQQSYEQLGKKLHEIKITNTPCYLTYDALRLWNQSNGFTEGMPSDTTRVTQPSSTSVGVDTALVNKVENDKRAAQNRSQIEAIIKWNKETYGY